jgi:hypothetical protein
MSSVAIGRDAGRSSQKSGAVAIGSLAGRVSQGMNSIAIGTNSGNNSQGSNAVSAGESSGQISQGNNTVAIGTYSGYQNQGASAVAIGNEAGMFDQVLQCVAIGPSAGRSGQRQQAVAIGSIAGTLDQGEYAIAIGLGAGATNQPVGSICINASGAVQNVVNQYSCVINPIRSATQTATYSTLLYDTASFEVLKSTVTTNNGAKTFVIDHPDKPDNYLVHACLEGPSADVYYKGRGKLVNWVDTVELPLYCNNWRDFVINLTPMSAGMDLFAGEVKKEGGRVFFETQGCVRDGDYYWTVFATRADIDVEPKKTDVVMNGFGPYSYIV